MLAFGESSTKTEAPVTIACITNSKCNPFLVPCRVGAEQARIDLASASGRPVDVLIMAPECPDATDAETPAGDAGAPDPCAASRPKLEPLQEAIDKHVNAIVIDVPNAQCTMPLIDKAVDAGIKVIRDQAAIFR